MLVASDLPAMPELITEAERFYGRSNLDYEAVRSFARHQYTNWDECRRQRAYESRHPKQTYDDLRRSTDEQLDGVLWADWAAHRIPFGGFA